MNFSSQANPTLVGCESIVAVETRAKAIYPSTRLTGTNQSAAPLAAASDWFGARFVERLK